MEVKDIREPAKEASAKTSSQFLKRAAEALKSSSIEFRDIADIKSAPRPFVATSTRVKANQAISVVNLAEEATAEIARLVASIDGIVEQAASPQVPAQRREVLEREANQLVEEIRRRAQSSTPAGEKPLTGEKVRIEVDDKAKVVEFNLPDVAQDAFGLGKISLDKQDNVSRTRTAIAQARDKLDSLQGAVQETKATIKGTIDALEVALQNSESANASIRDVDQALKLAGDTRIGIARDPRGALSSVGDFPKNVLELLK